MSLDPNKTYLVWNGTKFPNSTRATFKAPAGSTIDWGDGTVETFDTASTTVNTHTYTDGKTEHTITISGLTSIGYEAFAFCGNLESVTIGNSITSIDIGAFYNCSSLTNITIPNSITSIGHSAFIKTAYYNDKNNWENGVLYIGKHLIRAKSDLSGAYTIKDGTLTIAGYAFYECISLTSITIPNSVKSIDERVFYNCSSLTSINIPDSVTSIGYEAFSGCSSLKQLILFPSSPPTLGSNAIPATIQTIYVQQSSKAAYQAATNWTTFASKIVSDNIYLSFVRFNQKNKEYIDGKVDGLSTEVSPILSDYVDDALLGG